MKFGIEFVLRIAAAIALGVFTATPSSTTTARPASRNSVTAPPVRMMWQNTSTGDRSIWLMNGTSWDGSSVILPQVPTAWSIAGAGDFNADGSGDIVWQNTVTGDRSIWLMNGTSYEGQFVALPRVTTAWSIAGVGDFNSDDNPDLVWQNLQTGERSLWLMNGTSASSYVLLPTVSIDWKIAAVADFNADGKPDLVWQNTATGERSIWFMNGTTWGGSFAALPTESPEWRIAGATDFDGDKKPDLVWQNLSTGEHSIWIMNGATWTGQFVLLPTEPTEWSIAGILQPVTQAGFTQSNVNEITARDLCLTISIAPSAASECGDLRLVHQLPAIRAYGETKSPTLLYNSQHAAPYPIISLNVTPPRFPTQPTSVTATLRVNGSVRASGVWQGSSWPNARTVRVALGYDAAADPTNFYRYTIEVVANYGTSADTSYSTGNIAVVNRSSSTFGAGWWIAGFEQVLIDPAKEPAMWIGGDGSVRRYVKKDSVSWVAQNLDRPDTLKREGAGFVRILRGGLRVVFDSLGRHVKTRNRVNRETLFSYDSVGRLLSISIPTRDTVIPPNCFVSGGTVFCTAPTLGSRSWRFNYGAENRLTQVLSPAAGPILFGSTQTKSTTVQLSAGRISAIVDPDGSIEQFGFVNTASPRIASRTNANGVTTRFNYDSGFRLSASKLALASGDSAVTTFRQVASAGLPDGLGAGAIDTSFAYTRLDGPRRDVADTTIFFEDRFGSPRRVVDALGNATNYVKANITFPALVTEVAAADGGITDAEYDAAGHVSRVIVRHPYDDNPADAITTYTWDNRWDVAAQIVFPEGNLVSFGYDSVGNKTYEQLGTDAARRVTFGYERGSELLTSIREPGRLLPDSIVYDRLGNPNATISAIGVRRTMLSDEIGQLILVKTPVDSMQSLFQTDSMVYDVMGRVQTTLKTGPAINGDFGKTLIVNNYYDSLGRVKRIERRGTPDTAHVGILPTSYTYDEANRLKTTTDGNGQVEENVYDLAGNLTQLRTRRLDPRDTVAGARLVIDMQYDAVNRLTSRIAPAVHYPKDSVGMPKTQPSFVLNSVQGGRHAYPLYPNEGTGLLIKADTALFTYDPVGRMTSANNNFARISRSYSRNGLLKTETQRIRTLAPLDSAGSFDVHVYDLGYSYDLNGRRRTLTHPQSLRPSPSQNTTTYAYDSQTGDLTSVHDPLNNEYRFHYDVRGQLDTLYRPGAITETYSYDDAGRITKDSIRSQSTSLDAASNQLLRLATLRYDVRDKLLSSVSSTGPHDQTTAKYSGLGQVYSGSASSQATIDGSHAVIATSSSSDLIIQDAFGNAVRRTVSNSYSERFQQSASSGPTDYRYVTGTGRLVRITGNDNDSLWYDKAGNEVFRAAPFNSTFDRASYYSADGLLAVAESRSFTAPSTFRTVFEEYRYDALGRRILVRSRRWCENDPNGFEGECRIGKVRRTIWDGDQELYEVQMPGGDGSPYMEVDTGLVVLPLDTQSGSQPIDPNPFFGRVAYTHALSIDEPVGIVRMDYHDLLNVNNQYVGPRSLPPFALSPLWNTTGQAEAGVFDDGGVVKCDHSVNPATRCVYITWPGTWFAYLRPQFRPSFWYGTLLHDKQDHTGTHYRRNRNYDPQTGRFTQEDPIGLSGGINLYGFASGDPINLADPFGLCPTNDYLCLIARAGWQTLGGVIGLLGGGIEGGVGGSLLCGPGVCTVAGAAAGAAAGAVSGINAAGLMFDAMTAEGGGGFTDHGAKRVADPSRLNGEEANEVIENATARYVQPDRRTVFVQKVGERFNVVIKEGDAIHNTFKTLRESALNRLAKNFRWEPIP